MNWKRTLQFRADETTEWLFKSLQKYVKILNIFKLMLHLQNRRKMMKTKDFYGIYSEQNKILQGIALEIENGRFNFGLTRPQKDVSNRFKGT